MADTRLQELEKIGQSGGRNPAQESEYQNLLKQQPQQSSSQFNIPDPVETAKKLLNFQIEANKPAVATLQASVDPLKQHYESLLSSIKGLYTTASNFATRSTSTELGRRGLLPQSEEGQRALSESQQPIAASYGGLEAQTGLSEEQDLQNIARQIASLQAGNPESAAGLALNYLGQQQQANQFAQQLALQQQAQQFQQRYITIPGYGIYDVQNNNVLGGLSGLGQGGLQIINGQPYVYQP